MPHKRKPDKAADRAEQNRQRRLAYTTQCLLAGQTAENPQLPDHFNEQILVNAVANLIDGSSTTATASDSTLLGILSHIHTITPISDVAGIAVAQSTPVGWDSWDNWCWIPGDEYGNGEWRFTSPGWLHTHVPADRTGCSAYVPADPIGFSGDVPADQQ